MKRENVQFRQAVREDIPSIVQMLADDPLGAQRENPAHPLPTAYYDAFAVIAADPHNELVVAVWDGQVIGVLQLTFVPGLSYQGSWRMLVEGVRVAAAYRGQGVGAAMLTWAIDRARQRGCYMVQLTTNKQRLDARRFYERLGFEATHEGIKLVL
jgi:GNAT superfamily N-acetyltransferase